MSRSLQGELDGALKAVICEMQLAVDELGQVLESERSALGESDSEALNKAGSRKQALMLKLEQLDVERLQLSGQSPEEAARLEPEWNGVVQCLRSAQQLNQRNGHEVAQRLRQVRQALSILTGRTGETSVYGRAGEISVKMRSRTLAEA